MGDSERLNKDEERMKILNVVMAAHCYDMACMFGHFVERSSTIAGAKEVANIIQSFNGKNLSEYYRIKLTEDYSENALNCFEAYKSAKQIYPFEERALESFCKYYAHAGYDFKVWKFNSDYIIGIGMAALGYYLSKISKKQRDDRIDKVTSSESCVFSYSPSLVLRSFVAISAKYKEIETKVTNRQKNILQ